MHLLFPSILWPKDKSEVYCTDYLFPAEDFGLGLMQDFLLILSFGIASPPLAVLIAISVVIKTFFWQVLIGRFIEKRIEESNNVAIDSDVIRTIAQLGSSCDSVHLAPIICSFGLFMVTSIFQGI